MKREKGTGIRKGTGDQGLGTLVFVRKHSVILQQKKARLTLSDHIHVVGWSDGLSAKSKKEFLTSQKPSAA